MKLELDERYTEPEVLIRVSKLTPEVERLMESISEYQPESLLGFQGESVTPLILDEVIRVYTKQRNVYADSERETFRLKLRLYEAEELLSHRRWVRISHSELINLKWVKRFDLSLNGTIGVEMRNGIRTYVSRRFVSKIKQALGI